ncbi:unnamed protein product [Caenorhabditis nigoni]
MPINLLKLPRLVGVSVVTELSDYQEVFLLSLCSYRTKCLVVKAGIEVPKLAFEYGDSCGYNELKIRVVTGTRKRLPVTSVLHVSKLMKANLTVKLGHDNQADADFEYYRLRPGKFVNRLKIAIEPMAVQKVSQDYINSIFHYSGSYKLILSTKREGRLPNITNVKEIEIWRMTVDPEFLTNVMTTYPEAQSVFIYSEIVGDIPNESPFFQIPNFRVSSSCGPDYIHNFFGRNLCLDNATFTEQDLIQFLQKWSSNEAYYNLETMMASRHSAIKLGLIQQAINYEEYDPNEPEKRPEYLMFDIPYFRSNPTKYRLRDRNVKEIKRITDGKRGFLYVDFIRFNFVVQQN